MWKVCTLKTTKIIFKIKIGTYQWKNIHIHLLEDPKLSTNLIQSLSQSQGLPARNRKIHPTFHKEIQWTPNNLNDFLKRKSVGLRLKDMNEFIGLGIQRFPHMTTEVEKLSLWLRQTSNDSDQLLKFCATALVMVSPCFSVYFQSILSARLAVY